MLATDTLGWKTCVTDGGTLKRSCRVVAADKFGECRPIFGWRVQCGIRSLEDVLEVERAWPVKGGVQGSVMGGRPWGEGYGRVVS